MTGSAIATAAIIAHVPTHVYGNVSVFNGLPSLTRPGRGWLSLRAKRIQLRCYRWFDRCQQKSPQKSEGFPNRVRPERLKSRANRVPPGPPCGHRFDVAHPTPRLPRRLTNRLARGSAVGPGGSDCARARHRIRWEQEIRSRSVRYLKLARPQIRPTKRRPAAAGASFPAPPRAPPVTSPGLFLRPAPCRVGRRRRRRRPWQPSRPTGRL